MKRRNFLKLIGAVSITPSILSATPKKELTITASNSVTSSTITDIPGEYLEDDILNRMMNIINKTSYTDYIFVSSNIEKRLTAALEKTCFSSVYGGGLKRTTRFYGIPIIVNPVLEDGEIIIMNNSFCRDFLGQIT